MTFREAYRDLRFQLLDCVPPLVKGHNWLEVDELIDQMSLSELMNRLENICYESE